VLKGAQITFARRTAAIDCVVRDLSDGGACLKVFSPIGIPDTFELRLDSASVRFWHEDREAVLPARITPDKGSSRW
jgi:hypothetical protein